LSLDSLLPVLPWKRRRRRRRRRRRGEVAWSGSCRG
jgi:hypothetical protein